MRLLRGFGAAAAVASVLLASTAWALPTPEPDAFYRAPAHLGDAKDGTVLRSRAVTATALSVPLPARSWQLLYRSTGAHGEPVADVATVLVPLAPWTGPAARPLVSYQTAEDSVGGRCAPSYALRSGVLAATSNSADETALIALLLARGFAVVTSDYEGPASLFLAAHQEGFAVLDGIRAALRFPADGLGPTTPVGMWGYSGGAFATAWATALQRRHAPELKLAAIALGGTPADAALSMKRIDGGYGFGLVMGAMVGLNRAYPEAHLSSLFTAKGRAALAASDGSCTVGLISRYPFGSLADYTASPHPYDVPALRSVLDANSPGVAVTRTPVYSYHATGDELVPVAVDDALMASWCHAGDTVQRVRPKGGSHNTELVTGAPGAIGFLADRFAGKPPVSTCG
jgi:hypothetical protein